MINSRYFNCHFKARVAANNHQRNRNQRNSRENGIGTRKRRTRRRYRVNIWTKYRYGCTVMLNIKSNKWRLVLEIYLWYCALQVKLFSTYCQCYCLIMYYCCWSCRQVSRPSPDDSNTSILTLKMVDDDVSYIMITSL